MAEYKINENGEIIFPNGRKSVLPAKDSLWVEYIKLEYEILKSHTPTSDPIKIERYNKLKNYFENGEPIDKENAEKSKLALDEAREKIKQQIIESDKSSDNSVLYTAIANFNKKRNE